MSSRNNMEGLHYGGGTTLGRFNPFHTESGTAGVIRRFKEYLQHVTDNPAEFDYIVKEIIVMLRINVNDPSTLAIITNIMFSRAIRTPNLAYTGAKLCHAMILNELEVNGQRFKEIMLATCDKRFRKIKTQYERHAEDGTVPAVPDDELRGFTTFFAELYHKLKTENRESEVYNGIGLGIEELIKYFCGTKKDENILFASKILKLVGWRLDHAKIVEYAGRVLKRNMDAIFSTLLAMKASRGTSGRSLAVIEELERLRERDWNHIADTAGIDRGVREDLESEDQDPRNKIYKLPYEYYLESLSYYNFEEREEEGIYLDDEPDYVAAAYDEFLQEVEEKRNRSASLASTSRNNTTDGDSSGLSGVSGGEEEE